MKITIKNLKVAQWASEETLCFSATVYIDGVKAGEAANDGHGAPNMYQPRELEERLAAYAATLPPYIYNGMELRETADGVLDEVIERTLAERRLRRLCKGSTIYRVTGEKYEEGAYMQIKTPFTPAVALALRARHPQGVTIINEELTK